MNQFLNFGKQAATALLGRTSEDLIRAEASSAVMDSAAAEPFDRQVCKIAAAAFEVDGLAHSVHGILFEKLATAEEWSHGYKPFVDSVKRALAKCARAEDAEADEVFQKAALLPAAMMLHDQLGGNVLKTLVAAGAIGGAGVGSLGFLLSRNARQSSADNASVMEKIKTYKLLRKEIEEDMSAHDVIPAATGAKRRTANTDKRPVYDV